MTLLRGIFLPASFAQSPLSLSDAIAAGMKNNYGVQIARNVNASVLKDVTYGNAGMLPTVSAHASWDQSVLDAKVSTVVGGELDTEGASATLITAGIQAQWTLFDGTAMFIEYERLKSLADVSNLQLKIVLEDAVYSITAAYLDVIRQQRLQEAYHKKLTISNYRLDITRLRYQSGSGSEQEMIQAGVVRQADTTDLTQQIANLRKSEILLNKLLAADLNEKFTPEDTITLLELPPLDELLKVALSTNSDYLITEEEQHLAQLEINALRSKQYPHLDLKGSYFFSENETDASFIKYNRMLGPQIGLNAGITLFDGMNLRREISKAKVLQENERIRKKETEKEILSLVMNAWYDHYSLLQAVTLGKEGLNMAEKNMLIATEAYQTGLISSLQLREAQEDLFTATSDLYDALYKARVKETELLLLSGSLIKEN